MALSFVRSGILWGVLLLLPLWWLASNKRTAGGVSLFLRSFVLVLLLTALAGPQWAELQEEQTILFLVDGSWSVSDEQWQWSEQFINEAVGYRSPGDQIGLAAFGEALRWQRLPSLIPEASQGLQRLEQRPAGRYTNIEHSLNQAVQIAESEGARIVLLSDGWETQGQVRQLLPALRQTGVSVDIVSLPPSESGPEVRVKHLHFPARGIPGNPLQGHVVVHSTTETSTLVRVLTDGQSEQSRTVQLAAGYNYLPIQFIPAGSGFVTLGVEVEPDQDTIASNNRRSIAIEMVAAPAVLIVSSEGTAPDSVVEALASQGLEVSQIPMDQFPASAVELQEFSVVVLHDIPARAFSSAQHYLLQDYAASLGGGIVTVGGRNSYGLGGYDQSPFDVLLPVHAKKAEELAFPTLSLIIVVDKSGSMTAALPGTDGLTSMDVARQAAFGVVDLLLSQERLGLLAFDVDTEWVAPLQDVGDRQAMYAALRELKAGSGGTYIYPALVQSFEALVDEETAVRHVILLSDGVSQAAEYGELMQLYRDNDMTLSTVSIGPSTDLQLMARLAAETGGKHYYAEDVRSVPQIMAAEAERILGAPLIEEPTQALPTGSSPLTDGLDWENLPYLTGFAVTTPKDLADVYLIAEDNSPLLAGWRFGLGRVVSFMSDFGEEFAASWLDTPDYSLFWNRVLQWATTDLAGQGMQSRFVYEDGKGRIMVDALTEDGNYRNHLQLEAHIYHEDEVSAVVPLQQQGPGHYRADIDLTNEGVYLAVISGMIENEPVQQRAAAIVPYSPEYGLPPTDSVLPEIAAATAGREISDPQAVFAEQPEVYGEPISLWSWVMAAALLVWVADIAWRQLHRR